MTGSRTQWLLQNMRNVHAKIHIHTQILKNDIHEASLCTGSVANNCALSACAARNVSHKAQLVLHIMYAMYNRDNIIHACFNENQSRATNTNFTSTNKTQTRRMCAVSFRTVNTFKTSRNKSSERKSTSCPNTLKKHSANTGTGGGGQRAVSLQSV